MPSVIVKDNSVAANQQLRMGMIKFGEVFNKHFKEGSVSFRDLLAAVFGELLGPPGGGSTTNYRAYFLIGGMPRPLSYQRAIPGNGRVEFEYDDGGVTKTLVLDPVEDRFEDGAQRRYRMPVALSMTREDQLDPNNYLEGVVTDIVDVAADIEAAKKYTLSTIHFRRCM